MKRSLWITLAVVLGLLLINSCSGGSRGAEPLRATPGTIVYLPTVSAPGQVLGPDLCPGDPLPLVTDQELRHGDKANVLFSDGALRSLGEQEWRALGFRPLEEIIAERNPLPEDTGMPPGMMGPPAGFGPGMVHPGAPPGAGPGMLPPGPPGPPPPRGSPR